MGLSVTLSFMYVFYLLHIRACASFADIVGFYLLYLHACGTVWVLVGLIIRCPDPSEAVG